MWSGSGDQTSRGRIREPDRGPHGGRHGRGRGAVRGRRSRHRHQQAHEARHAGRPAGLLREVRGCVAGGGSRCQWKKEIEIIYADAVKEMVN